MTHRNTSGSLQRRKTTTTLAAGLALAALCIVAAAQGPPPPATAPPSPPPQDAVARILFEPELIMRHQRELSLSEEQREAFIQEVQRTQSDLVPIQLEMMEATEELAALLEEAQIEEARALAQADRIMALESEVKKTHLTLLIRIKNLLTDGQRDQLRQIRGRRTPRENR
jgi:Spy/CpxP family protein refolding chaperone